MTDFEESLRKHGFPEKGGGISQPMVITPADTIKAQREALDGYVRQFQVMAQHPQINEQIQRAFEKGELGLSLEGFLATADNLLGAKQ